MCHVETGEDLGDVEYDAKANQRTIWQMQEDRRRDPPTDQGLADTPSALEDPDLVFDPTRQIPPEPLHAELIGISLLAVSKLVLMLTEKWRAALSAHLRVLHNTAWPNLSLQSLVLSRRQRVKLNAEEVCRVVQLLPFALTWPSSDRIGDWLQPTMFSASAATEMQARCGTTYCAQIREAFLALATSNASVFAAQRETGSASLRALQTDIDTARQALQNILGADMNRPNSHTTRAHLVDAVDMFGVAKNFDCRTLETKHAPFRHFIHRSSSHKVETQMMEWANMRQALTLLALSAQGHFTGEQSRRIPAEVLALVQEDPVFAQLLERVASTDPHGGRAGDAPRTHTFTKPQGKKRKLNSPERAIIGWRKSKRLKVQFFDKGTLPDLGTIKVHEVWECRLPADMPRPPRGPRAGHALVQVQGMALAHDALWVQVRWYKVTTAQQTTTQCAAVTGPSDHSTWPTLLPLHLLVRRAHLVQHATVLLYNKYFFGR